MRNTNVQSINPKYQSLVNKAVAWDIKYEFANEQRDIAYDNTEYDYAEDDKVWRKWNKQCEKAYDKYLDLLDELPKRERTNVEKQLQY
jgi:hypothetical protein